MKKYYLSKKELEIIGINDLIKEVIHVRQLLLNSRQKARIWEIKAHSLETRLNNIINESKLTASLEPDHPLVGTINAIEDFLYKNASFIGEGEYRKVLAKMFELTEQLLAFKREQKPEPILN